jgi:hypothetical protein
VIGACFEEAILMRNLAAALAVTVLGLGAAHAEQSETAASRMFSCRPQTLRKGGTLVLRFALPHPAELGVQRPDGTPIFLVYDRDGSMAPGLTPFVSKGEFRQKRVLRLHADSAGTPWVAGHDTNEKIFTEPGEYEFLLREVLETDVEYPSFTCRIRYQP